MLSPLSHFAQHMHGDQPTTSARRSSTSAPCLAPASRCTRSLLSVGHRALTCHSRVSPRRSRDLPLASRSTTAQPVRVPAPGPRWVRPAASSRPARRSPATKLAVVEAGRGRWTNNVGRKRRRSRGGWRLAWAAVGDTTRFRMAKERHERRGRMHHADRPPAVLCSTMVSSSTGILTALGTTTRRRGVTVLEEAMGERDHPWLARARDELGSRKTKVEGVGREPGERRVFGPIGLSSGKHCRHGLEVEPVRLPDRIGSTGNRSNWAFPPILRTLGTSRVYLPTNSYVLQRGARWSFRPGQTPPGGARGHCARHRPPASPSPPCPCPAPLAGRAAQSHLAAKDGIDEIPTADSGSTHAPHRRAGPRLPIQWLRAHLSRWSPEDSRTCQAATARAGGPAARRTAHQTLPPPVACPVRSTYAAAPASGSLAGGAARTPVGAARAEGSGADRESERCGSGRRSTRRGWALAAGAGRHGGHAAPVRLAPASARSSSWLLGAGGQSAVAARS
jgi:hypothetical protein